MEDVFERHTNVTIEELDELERSHYEVNTTKTTLWAVNCFINWTKSENIVVNLKTIETHELNSALRRFYGSVRSAKGALYGISSLVGLRAGLNRYLNEPPVSRSLCLRNDPDFTSANKVFKGLVKQIKKDGDKSIHHPALSREDIHKLISHACMDPTNPTGLLNKVWFNIQLNLRCKGKGQNRQLRPDSLIMKTDVNGARYYTISFNADSKKHKVGDPANRRGYMFEQPGSELCPVRALEKYLSKLPQNAPALYMQPKKQTPADGEAWYTMAPVGINYLGSMLPRMCKEAQTSIIYRNRCLQHTMDQHTGLVEAREIVAVSGQSDREIDSGSMRQKNRAQNPDPWPKQEQDNLIIKLENLETENTTDVVQDIMPAASTSEDHLLITKLQCMLERKQERITALEQQVEDLMQDRKFLRSQIENLTSNCATLAYAPLRQLVEGPKVEHMEPKLRKRGRERMASSSFLSQSSDYEPSELSDVSTASSEHRRKRRGKDRKRAIGIQYVIHRYKQVLSAYNKMKYMTEAFRHCGVDRNTIVNTASIAELHLVCKDTAPLVGTFRQGEESLVSYAQRCSLVIECDVELSRRIDIMKANGELLPLCMNRGRGRESHSASIGGAAEIVLLS